MSSHCIRGAIGAAVAALCGGAAAQVTLKEVVVTGNPLGTSEFATPVQSLSGPELLLRVQPTLGETLNRLPGVSSTYFGPTASRPVIRGLDGDRVRILDNSGAALDASSLSYDHAVTADPIAVERIEVLRGPAALLYGGNAIGGVVNLIDNRIPRQPSTGINGKADFGLDSGSRERSGAVLVEGGDQRLGLHVDASRRQHGDVRVPIALACAQQGTERSRERLCNSGGEADSAAFGGSLFFERGYLGASVSGFRSSYGSVAEDEVAIDMKSRRFAIEGELRDLGGWLRSVKLRAGHADYRHTEFDAGVTGTLFRNRGNDLRVEVRHANIGPLQGVIGVQAEASRFSADGDEAFAPYSRTRQRALFAFEELATSWGKVTLGARSEDVRVDSLGNPVVPRFGLASRSYRPLSGAVGLVWNAAPEWQLTGNLAHSERAPKDYELFADGPHVATGAWEVGNPALGKERSRHLELGAQWKRGAHQARVNVYTARFTDYVALLATGNLREEELPEFVYTPVRATFSGLELSGTSQLLAGAHTLELAWRADTVRATNRTTREPLPRIAPLRLGATLIYGHGPWSARLGVDHHARQNRVPSAERATVGYSLWSAALTYRMPVRSATLLWYARVENATDRLAYSASSILTQSSPGRVPLAGRNLRVGVSASF